MAQILCPDCKKEISNKAKECPHCGYPIKEEREAQAFMASLHRDVQRKKRRKWIILGVIVVLGLIGMISGKGKKEPSAQPPAAAIEQKDPCTNIKTVDDWEKASTLWRNSHPECKPR